MFEYRAELELKRKQLNPMAYDIKYGTLGQARLS